MRFFCQVLLNSILADDSVPVSDDPKNFLLGKSLNRQEDIRRNKQAFNRWFLALTLHQNPGLIRYRNPSKLSAEKENNGDPIVVI